MTTSGARNITVTTTVPAKPLRRIAACVEYCGANYRGWQYQSNAPSVQARVERAVSRVADADTRVIAAGRTDAGVHGGGQIIHFDTRARRAPVEWRRGVNTHLPDDIALIWTREVGGDFHARFAACARAYRYIILNRPVAPSYLRSRVAWHALPLDDAPMRRAAAAFIGRHDFSAFRGAQCQAKHPHRDLRRISIGRAGEWLWLDFTADGFLHHMVRNLVGTLVRIGEGVERPAWAGELLAGRDRSAAGPTAPAAGLYLTTVTYAPRHRLPPPPPPPRFW